LIELKKKCVLFLFLFDPNLKFQKQFKPFKVTGPPPSLFLPRELSSFAVERWATTPPTFRDTHVPLACIVIDLQAIHHPAAANPQFAWATLFPL